MKPIQQYFCPICGTEIIPKDKYRISVMMRRKTTCRKCMYEEKSKNMTGSNNHFFGKSHTIESKDKKIKNTDYSVYKTKEFRDKMSEVTSGTKNAMFGRSVYSVWVEKYGVTEADRRMESAKQKWSLSSSGENNGMFGVPSPHGCGAGWSGWYKGYFFRSLHELAFLIKTPLDNVSSAEGKEYAIKYVIDGVERNYFADYIIDNNTLVEIKPKALQTTKENIIKKEYAEKYCSERGLLYKLIDCGSVDYIALKGEIESGNVTLTERTKEKFDKYMKSINTGR